MVTANQKKALTEIILTFVTSGQKGTIRKLGEKFSLKTNKDKDCFNALWNVYKWSVEYKKSTEKDRKKEVEDALSQYFGQMIAIEGKGIARRGFQKIKRLPAAGKYVVFSDHHLLYKGHRHDFFSLSGNAYLYSRLLEKYFDKNYTLIENGDVEDLVIFEPELNDCQKRAKMTKEELVAHRKTARLTQLRNILKSNENLYNQIRDTFHAKGRLVRIAGNHDQDLQYDEYLDVLRSKYKDITAYDFVLLDSANSSIPAFAIAHGHQFDANCTPKYARFIGEAISECLGFAFQGSDRIWKWEDGPKTWASTRAFKNNLVGATPCNFKKIWDDPAGLISSTFENFLENPFETLKGLISHPVEEVVENIVETLIEDRDFQEWFIEAIFGENIAWNYFESQTPAVALLDEVWTGDEFFKFRHTDELVITSLLKQAFKKQKQQPTLVLGHTHEVRLNSIDKSGNVENKYLNSGTAGRFQNLIWALEIDNGTPRIVSWHFPEPILEDPRSSSGSSNTMYRPPSRTVYTARGGELVPASSPSELT
jgi:hypothetical protein